MNAKAKKLLNEVSDMVVALMKGVSFDWVVHVSEYHFEEYCYGVAFRWYDKDKKKHFHSLRDEVVIEKINELVCMDLDEEVESILCRLAVSPSGKVVIEIQNNLDPDFDDVGLDEFSERALASLANC